MKKLKLLLIGLLVMLPVLAWTLHTRAQSVQTGNTVSLPADQTVNSSLYASGQTIMIDATVNGDVYCWGQTVTISGTVNGDVLCAAQTLTIAGKVNGDIRVAGQTVAITNTVTGNATIAAQTLTSDPRARVGGDITIVAQSATVSAAIGRDIAGSMQNLTINNTVGRNISVEVSKLTLEDAANVDGGVYYTSWQKLERKEPAKVAGEVKRTTPKQPPDDSQRFAIWGFATWFVLSMLLLSLVLILVAPRIFQVGSSLARPSLGVTFLVGFASTILIPIAIIGLMVTVIGIPLGLIILFAWLVVLGLSWPLAAYLTGRLIWRKGTNAILIMLIGTLTLVLLSLIPLINFFVILATIWFGVGMALRVLWRLFGKRAYTVTPATTVTITEVDKTPADANHNKKKEAP